MTYFLVSSHLWFFSCVQNRTLQNAMRAIPQFHGIYVFPFQVQSGIPIVAPYRILLFIGPTHYDDVIMNAIASQITSLAIVYSTVYSDADQRKHQSTASLAFVWGIQRGPVNSPHKRPVTRKMFPFDDVIMHADIMRRIIHDWQCVALSASDPQQYQSPLIHNHTTFKCHIAFSNIITSCDMPPCILFTIHVFLNAWCLIICINEHRTFAFRLVLNAHRSITN